VGELAAIGKPAMKHIRALGLRRASLEDILQRIVAIAEPQRVLLFGSSARRQRGPKSDVDLLVVKGGEFDQSRLLGDIYEALYGVGLAVDVVLVSTEQLHRYQDAHCLILAPALQEGREVYRAPALSAR
jgi:uncharacterized protein